MTLAKEDEVNWLRKLFPPSPPKRWVLFKDGGMFYEALVVERHGDFLKVVYDVPTGRHGPSYPGLDQRYMETASATKIIKNDEVLEEWTK